MHHRSQVRTAVNIAPIATQVRRRRQ